MAENDSVETWKDHCRQVEYLGQLANPNLLVFIDN